MADTARSQGGGRYAAVMLALLALAIFINYVDRGNLGVAAPLMAKELRIDAAGIGLLGSAFAWTYSPGQLLAGWLVGRLNPYRTLALGLVIWSLATLMAGFAQSFAALLGLRILLGLGESAGFPAAAALLARYLPPARLGSANALMCVGLMLGPAAGAFFGGLIMAHAGWRAVFVTFGLISLVWLVPWLIATHGRAAIERTQPAHAAGEPSHLAILSRRELWGAAVGHFAAAYPFFLLLTWLPSYLVKAHGYTLPQMGALSGLVYLLSAACALAGGLIADRWMALGGSSTLVRKTMVAGAGLVSIAAMLACASGQASLAIAGLLLFALPNGVASFTCYAIGQTLGGPSGAGRWVGWQSGLGTLSAIVAPWLTGAIIQATGHFELAFLAAAGIGAVGVAAWLWIIPRIEPVAWDAGLGVADI
jgi:MFS family permease